MTLFQGGDGLGDAVEPGDRFGTLAKGRFFNDFNGDAFSDLAVGVPFESVGNRLGAGLVNLLEVPPPTAWWVLPSSSRAPTSAAAPGWAAPPRPATRSAYR